MVSRYNCPAIGMTLFIAVGCSVERTAVRVCSELGPLVGEFAISNVDSVASVVMSGDSTAFVLDSKNSVLWRSVLNADHTRVVARHGSGPEEVHGARGLLSWVDGGVLLVEWDGSVLHFDANGRFVKRFRVPGPKEPGNVAHRMNWTATDRRGSIYGYSPFARATSDSVEVVRCMIGTKISCDTVQVVSRLFLDPPKPQPVANAKGFSVGVPSSFGHIAVARNGRRLIVSATTLQVLAQSENDKIVQESALDRISLPLSDADWENLVEADSVRSMKVIQAGLAVALASGAKIEDIPTGLRRVARAAVRPKEFPQLGAAPPIQSPDGTIWIERGHAPLSAYRLDLIDSLNRYRCVRVPSRMRVVAIGTKIGILATFDDDDIEHLKAFSLLTPSGRPRER